MFPATRRYRCHLCGDLIEEGDLLAFLTNDDTGVPDIICEHCADDLPDD
jgi:DNA-directed RNA polymerase subunit RPC12/RpoP